MCAAFHSGTACRERIPRIRSQTAAHLVDRVIPPVPVRQWVISVPKRLRGFLADRPAAVAALTRIFIEEIERLLGAAAGVTSDASAPAAKVRYVLPRHKAANWVGPSRSRKSTRPGANGVVELSPFEFLDRLADLVPPPRKHRHRYHGVFAPNHRLRKAVKAVAIGSPPRSPRAGKRPPHPSEGSPLPLRRVRGLPLFPCHAARRRYKLFPGGGVSAGTMPSWGNSDDEGTWGRGPAAGRGSSSATLALRH